MKLKSVKESPGETSSEDEYNDYEKDLLKKARKEKDISDSEEELFNIRSESESSEDENDDLKNRDSDLDNDDYLPDEKAWGEKKKDYYFGDRVDEEYVGRRIKDIDAAEIEEEEAKKIQQRLLEQLDDEDFSVGFFQSAVKEKTKEKGKNEIIEKDLSKLSKREKLELLKKQSPEFIGLIDEFKDKCSKLIDNENGAFIHSKKLENLLNPKQIEYLKQFAKVKENLSLAYLMHIMYYFLLKSSTTNQHQIKYHPSIKYLLKYQEVLKQLNDNDNLNEIIETMIIKQNQKKLNILKQDEKRKKKKHESSKQVEEEFKDQKIKTEKSKRKQNDDDRIQDDNVTIKKPKIVNSDSSDSLDEWTVEKKHVDFVDSKNNESEDESAKGNEKRAITYEMSKNKGLTPHRKKELRNPRVKHRNKYRKAQIRRKGAVREVRKELSRYGGEISGIKRTVVKSIKIK